MTTQEQIIKLNPTLTASDAANIAKVIQARSKGLTWTAIEAATGVPETTARRWTKKYAESSGVRPDVSRVPSPRINKSEEAIEQLLEGLAPIQLPIPSQKKGKSTANSEYVLVIGDMHFPKECKKTIDIFFQVVEDLQPASIILNGDTVDLLAVSRYPKDVRHNYNLLEERIAYHNFLHTLQSIAPKDCKIYEVNANHSGNDVNGRWWRYLSERLGEVACFPELKQKLSYEEMFLGQFAKDIQLVDFVNVTDSFIILHGDVVRKNGGYSARGMLDKLNISLMHNHTHRIGSTAQRIPAIGKRVDKQIFAWENGCACDLNPVYASAPNWQNGFSIISVDTTDSDQPYSVEQVIVENGKANISTMGGTYYAD